MHQLEQAAGFKREDTPEQKLDKLETALKLAVPDIAAVAPLFVSLLSLPPTDRFPALAITSQQWKSRTLAALVTRLEGMAAQVPLLIVFEDAHWIDPTSIEFLNLLVARSPTMRMLLVVTTRERLEHPWTHRSNVSELVLLRLDAKASATMVNRLLEGQAAQAVPANFVDRIVAKTDGVPLFIEEFTQTMMTATDTTNATHSGAHLSAVPATLQDSLMARLDQLGPAKEVAQMGAVIGREFSHELVAALLPMSEDTLREALDRLTRSAIVYPRGAHGSTRPAATFVFKHALVQDAAYASLLRTKRQASHGRIATILETGSADYVRVEPELIAHHYTEAHQWLPAASQWAAASHRSLDRSANLEALRHATRGLEVVANADASDAIARTARDRIEANLEISRGAAYRAVSGFAASDAERSFIRASELCTQLDDAPRLIDARRGLFSCYYARGALALAREQAIEVAALGERLNEGGSRMLGHWMLGCVQFWQGEFAAARDELEQAFALYDPREQRAQTLALQIDPGVNALLHLSWARWVLGYPDEAIRTGEQAIDTARQLAQPFALSMALFFACATRICCAHESAARALLDELTTLCAEQALGYMGSCARVLKAQLLIADDKAQAALEEIHIAFTEFKTQEAGVGLPWAMSTAAAAYARLGRAEEGLATIAQAAQAAARNGEHHWSAELWRLKGELLLALPVPDESGAQTCFIEASSLARRQGARSLELRAATSLAGLSARQRNPGGSACQSNRTKA